VFECWQVRVLTYNVCWQVRVLTYNVLSSSLCEADYHVKCSALDLDERTRLRRVCDLLAPEVASGTFICL
jgi:hypothetical protein